MTHNRKIAVIGLGYVGLPVAAAFARSGVPVTGFDIDRGRVEELTAGRDRTLEVDAADLKQPSLRFTHDPAQLAAADFYIVTVPTPIDRPAGPTSARFWRRPTQSVMCSSAATSWFTNRPCIQAR